MEMATRAKIEKITSRRLNVKDLLTVFFDCYELVRYEFLSQGRMVNKECYVNIMRHWREEIRQKRTELWKHQSWILQYDNTPAHTSMLVL